MTYPSKVALLFPGQGAEKVGMGHDFFREYPLFRQTFEQAEDLLQKKLSTLIFEGPEEELHKTEHAQTALFVTSLAILRVLESITPLSVSLTAGLSFGEYCALVASQKLSFQDALFLVNKRGIAMAHAAEKNPGLMAAILGLQKEDVLPLLNEEAWIANCNCHNQVVISGTRLGIERATVQLFDKGAKKIIPLKVKGAFHCPLMQDAALEFEPFVQKATLFTSPVPFYSTTSGKKEEDEAEIKKLLIDQFTSTSYFEKIIHAIEESPITHCIEIGPEKTLLHCIKRSGGTKELLPLEKVEDLKPIELALS